MAVEGPESAATLADWLTAAKPFLGDLAAALEVVDSVAPGMTLIDGSILPAATVDPATGGLRWSLKAQLQDRDIQLRYRLRADRIGSRVPVDNLAATVAYTDGLGIAGGFLSLGRSCASVVQEKRCCQGRTTSGDPAA